MLHRAGGLLVAAAAVLLLAGTPAAALPSGPSGQDTAAPAVPAQSVVTAVRVGRHENYDRLVFDFTGRVPGFQVSYVPEVIADPSGRPVPLEGSAFVLVRLQPTSTSTHAPQGTITPRFPMLRQVKGAGDFEGVTSYGVGLARRTHITVFTLTGPNRLVLDFAHAAITKAPAEAATTLRSRSTADHTRAG